MNDQQTQKQSIEQLTQRYHQLDRKKTTAEANLKTAQDHLEELKKEAREKYGTDDLEELKKKLADMEAENERKRAQYQESLDRIEQELSEVEQKFKNVEPDNARSDP
jgi:predicted  nucleic acid-binding Zn-ribbon protein